MNIKINVNTQTNFLLQIYIKHFFGNISSEVSNDLLHKTRDQLKHFPRKSFKTRCKLVVSLLKCSIDFFYVKFF